MPENPVSQTVISTTGLDPSQDTYLRSDAANKNYGLNDSLRVMKVGTNGSNRLLIGFDQATVASTVGTDSLISVSLTFTIKRNGNNWGASGRYIAAYRMTQSWVEGGATWSCANDLTPSNNVPNCPTTAWSMGAPPNPWATPLTSQVKIVNNQTGLVSLDVTADVRAYLTQSAVTNGWIVKLLDETQTGTVVFHSRQGVSKPQLTLTTYSPYSVPSQAPTTLPSWVYSSSNLDSNTSALPTTFLKNIVIVQFKAGTSQAQRQTAVDAVGGSVVGGVRPGSGEGHYYLSIPDTTRGAQLLTAARALNGLVQVELATVEFAVTPSLRKPKDGPNWTNWHLGRDTLTGQNWALEAIFAPLAWGCASGSTADTIAIVDGGFPGPLPVDLNTMSVAGPPSGLVPADSFHGLSMASIIGARGDNGTGMTGVMLSSTLKAYEVGKTPNQMFSKDPTYVGRVLQGVTEAARAGARVINLSLGVSFTGPLDAVADSLMEAAGRAVERTLVGLAAQGRQPLLVFAAGNENRDAKWSGFPRAATMAFGNQVIVVTASTPDSSLWMSLPKGSNTGSLVDVAAPGKGIGILRPSGIVDTGSGTSAAAAIVSGIGGLLASFDPRLTAAEIKQFIIAGADSGGWVANGSGGPYRIVNAYQSLRLAAKRPGAPVCNFPVSVSGHDIVLERPGGNETITVTGSGSSDVFAPSVAQGGKLISVSSHNLSTSADELWLVRWNNGSWSVSGGTNTYYDRIFLERDTAYVKWTPDGSSTRVDFKRGNGTTDAVPDIYRAYLPSGMVLTIGLGFDIAPGGDFLVAGGEYQPSPFSVCGPYPVSRWSVIPLPTTSGSPSVFYEVPWNNPPPPNGYSPCFAAQYRGVPRWSPDGEHVTLPTAYQFPPYYAGRLVQKRVTAQGTTTNFDIAPGRDFFQSTTRYSSDGRKLYTYEFLAGGQCESVTRLVPSSVVQQTGICLLFDLPYIPNAHQRDAVQAIPSVLSERRWRSPNRTQGN